MSNDIHQFRHYGNQFRRVEGLLLYFLEDAYCGDIEDIDTIKRYIIEDDMGDTLRAIQEGKEILALDKFPFEWITTTTGIGFKYPDDCRKWLIRVIDTLEEEARKAGKIR